MSSIRKSVLVNGQAHFIEVNSSLELEEVEVTGADPVSGKVVQVSLSPMLKASQRQDNFSPFSIPPSAPAPVWPGLGEQTQTPSSPAPMDMFSEPASAFSPFQLSSPSPPPAQGLEAVRQKSEKEEVDDTLNGMYRY